ncbi:putative Site-specific DNA-methyltransferase (adenine-specific) [Candidatus Methylacidithermus pantelleriae]|uniref:Putative Site-specific DNA-methyltransferase (Adenine-specific) n=1 Tax=Candidatus Methylacidithermus pantelleriae TaxID=2744239 RepID=A0A8J2BRH4_9BACT|nr:N-6 DNA methylase [Candidatus Methylacidithermus pantelleriae]CAF0704615.1 putative Site-specific DNA-methyltransferase (adenine-specific) [Candidatus Methylacidithermus pantelleriae]
MAKTSLAICGIHGKIGQGESFTNDRFPDLKVDYALANAAFNMKRWAGDQAREARRCKFGVPPAGNANFAWVHHIVHHLEPVGAAGFVLANGSMSSIYYSAQIPGCLWFLARDKKNGRLRDRRGQVLFIDACKLGRMVARTHRELTEEDIRKVADTYHAWRGEKDAGEYRDVPGFCKSAPFSELGRHGFVLTPGRYVGAPPQEDGGEPFEALALLDRILDRKPLRASSRKE